MYRTILPFMQLAGGPQMYHLQCSGFVQMCLFSWRLKQLYTHELDISSDIYLKDSISKILKGSSFLNANLCANQTLGKQILFA